MQYFEAAFYEETTTVPVLLALKGLPGTGKSTLAAVVARQLMWALLDKDDIKIGLDRADAAAGAVAYEVMFRIAKRQLTNGLSVVCDSPLGYVESYRNASSIAAETGARLAVLEAPALTARFGADGLNREGHRRRMSLT
jgi:predicted kinase